MVNANLEYEFFDSDYMAINLDLGLNYLFNEINTSGKKLTLKIYQLMCRNLNYLHLLKPSQCTNTFERAV